MSLRQVFPSERRSFKDPLSGADIEQLTNWRCHNYHLYFTNNGLWDGGRRLLIGSHRNNASNLFSVELAGGEMTQLTDYGPDDKVSFQNAFLNPLAEAVYYSGDGELVALDLRTLKRRVLLRKPDGYNLGNHSVTADGKTVCVSVGQDLSDRIRMDLKNGYVGFHEYHAARPHCMIVGVPVGGGRERTIFEDRCWLGHINTSPTLNDKLTFCHEGPWHKVDQRMWMLDIPSGTAVKLRPQVPGEAVGHEYWFADGKRIGYHGKKDGVARFGWITADGTKGAEYDFPFVSWHFHSMDENLVVGDGKGDRKLLMLWRLRDGKYEEPRVLAENRCSFHSQVVHAHPRIFKGPDGRTKVLYTCDANGYGNVFIADAGDVEKLPPVPGPRAEG
jgi:oligogalacturonide lyase